MVQLDYQLHLGQAAVEFYYFLVDSLLLDLDVLDSLDDSLVVEDAALNLGQLIQQIILKLPEFHQILVLKFH